MKLWDRLLAEFRHKKSALPVAKPTRSPPAEPFRCGTPYLRQGGVIIARTENVSMIIRDTRRSASKKGDQEL
jgi:hypothetical protein